MATAQAFPGPRRRPLAACAGLLIACLAWLAGGTALAQGDARHVALIMENLPPPGSPAYRAIRRQAGRATGQVLALTKSEMWSVLREDVEPVKAAARQRGASAKELGSDWSRILHVAPPDMAMTDKQRSMMEQARASAATTGIGIVAAPAAPMVEYALTRDASAPGHGEDAAKITIALSERTALTLTRTSVDVMPDKCVWRGTVDGTGAPALLMWWPGGRIAGTVQHEGRMYSIRHMGGEIHAVVEMREDRMPRDHAPAPQRRRDDPSLRDGPLPEPPLRERG